MRFAHDCSLCGGSLRRPRLRTRGISCLRARPKDGTRLAALRSPFGNLRGVTYKLVSYPTLAGRGGSVSRRDHNQAAGNRPPTHSGILYGRKTNSNRSYSSGEGVWGRGASLREAASPPASPPPRLFGREREGGRFSIRKAPSLAINSLKNFCSCRIFRRRTCGSLGSGLGRWPHESAP